MNTFQQYKAKRTAQNPEFWKDYPERFKTFQLGVLLKQARQEAGLTQEEVAQRLQTSKTVVSRIENHTPDMRLALIEKMAVILGKRLHIVLD